jgi:hypothetical protein
VHHLPERFRDDRLFRWGVYATAPFVWLAVALLDPLLLIVPPILVFALHRAIGYGMVERFETPPDPDLF